MKKDLQVRLQNIFDSILEEHIRRLKKWGVQSYPVTQSSDPIYYGVPKEAVAKAVCDQAFARAKGSWVHVIVEELAEAIEATGKSPSETRTELVQLASVVISTIEAIDKEQRNG